MANIGELSVGVKVDQTSLDKATKDVQTTFKKTGDDIEQNFTKKTSKGFSNIGSSLSGLGGVIAWVFSVWAIVGFTKQLFTLWSDLEEVSSKFNVVFKGSENVKNQFNEMAQATNRSSLDLLTFGSWIWNVLSPLWLAQEEVDGLSVSMTKLAIDVASFNNVSDAQAINAFTSALTWEREALKSLWIVISDADVKNKAYALWLATTWSELTKQQTALATYQLLLDNTANAQGDAVRTADSFANQLKGLRGAIKDVFANAGKDVAGQTAGLLKNITVFVSSYGWAIINTIVETGKMIGSVIGDLIKTFWDLFSFIRSWSWESGDDMNNFAFLFMKIVQGFWVGVKFIATVIKTLVNVVAIALWSIVEIFVAGFKSIWDAWNILSTAFTWTLKSIVNVAELWANVIAQVFVGMAEAIVWVFKGIADNVAVAVKKASNLAIKGINWFIDLANKIPWVNIQKLAWFGDDGWKSFNLSIGKNISALKGQFDAFGNSVASNYAGIGASFGNISNNFKWAVWNIKTASSGILDQVWQDWWNFATDVQASNDRITKSLQDGANKQLDNAKKYDQWYFNILDILDKYKWSVDDATKKNKWLSDAQKKQQEIAKESIDAIKKQYNDWEKKIDDVNKASEKLAEDTKKYNQEIWDSIRELWKELETVSKDYTKAIEEINTSTSTDIAERSVEVAKDLADVEKQIAETKAESNLNDEDKKTKILDLQNKISLLQTKISENTDKTNESTKKAQQLTLDKYNSQLKVLQNEWVSVENQEKLTDLEKQRTDLLKEQQFIIANTTEAQRIEAERRAGLSEAERTKEDAQVQIDAKTKEFEAEKEKINSLIRINNAFLNLKSLNEQQFNKIISDARFQAMSQEEQELILKLAREKIELTNQKDAIIQMQTDIANATIELSNGATAIQMANITALKNEYATLIGQIQTAIAKQRELNSAKKGFASGWYTWSGWANEVAGLVHKGEWVAPKWMVNSMKPLFDNLEASRSRGFANGWFTSTTNKTQNNNITVNSGIDLRGFIDYAKWKL